MTRGIVENFYKYRVVQGQEPPKYFKMISEITSEFNIGKNTIYNIINKNRNILKSKKALDLQIEKIKLPVRKSVNLTVIELQAL